MDADTTMAKYSYEEKLQAFSKGEYDILLGTQMVAKGLNFPNVTLVGVISIDQQLYNDDFRSSEKAFDLLTQVVGRSGRGDFKGKAVIQTMLSDNDIIKQANSILERCTYGERFSQMSMNVLRQEKKKKTGAFFLGTISGAVVSAAILLAI
jgi:primosomal protein N'